MKFVLLALTFLHAIPSGKFTLHVGDVYEWTIQDLEAITESPEKVTILDSGTSSILPADSGKAWKILVERPSATPESLELFQFKNGDLRWSKGSANFPIEFQAPARKMTVSRGNIWWGMDSSRLTEINPMFLVKNTNYWISCDSTGMEVSANMELAPGTISAEYRGIWSDSLGALWIRGTQFGTKEWVLVAINGKRNEWHNGRFDSIKAAAQFVVERAKRIRYPSLNDTFTWKHTAADNKSKTNYTIRSVVIESLPDSAKWVRRTLEISKSSENDSAVRWNRICRWDSTGKGTCIPSSGLDDFVNTGWKVDRTDIILGDTAFKWPITGSISAYTSYRDVEFLATGELLRGTLQYITGTIGPCTGTCMETPNYLRYTWTLVSSPNYNSGIKPASVAAREKLDQRAIQSLLATDPDATVLWVTLSGRSGHQSITQFLKTKRAHGAIWLQVTTTSGKKLQGMFLGL